MTADASKETQIATGIVQPTVDTATGVIKATNVGVQTGVQGGAQTGKRHLLGNLLP